MQRMLVQSHQMAGDETLVISSTNEFIITPVCRLFGIANMIGTQLETGPDGRYTGNYIGTPSLKEGKITRLNQWLAERGETLESYGKTYFTATPKRPAAAAPRQRTRRRQPRCRTGKRSQRKGWPVLNFK
ncbi:putative hydrolase [Neisseria gonorrhoeae]|uniref:Putative hydrolase n=1 Tax=Neisseria gonorrhoeae TaxID=485 RepID=A0A378VW39_NEIGO|nr:putative hydrolase [Neisseria gonorrhoeae]